MDRVQLLIKQNISDEHFGVAELAEAMHMSRSSLLRKIKKHTNLSASQFIRKERLGKGMELLRESSLTVSEISGEVGFDSPSYFIKCFREEYGFPPGEARKMDVPEEITPTANEQSLPYVKIGIGAVLVLAVILLFLFLPKNEPAPEPKEKSIAILPFKNESSDSSNLYFVNGLMESALSNLQKIEELRVISRTSVEKFRNSSLTVPEIAEELDVSYIVEGSGQKIGDQILLNIQLIDASSDSPIWAEQYNHEVVDVFSLQNDIARNIAEAVEVIITPEELEQIEKIPTENMVAYDYYLKALDPFNSETREGLEEAIPLFEKAIEEDPQFAMAYAYLAISYYFLDIFQAEKQYTEVINNYADKALLYDSKSAVSLIAKAFYYMQTREYNLAVPHLEKALEYNPNSAAVVQMLADLYASYIPNTSKYLAYALKGIKLDIAATDSSTKSNLYLHLSNAFVQTGFVDEAIEYINKSLEQNPDNFFSPYVKAFILAAKDKDLERTSNMLKEEWIKDTTRLDILQDIGKIFYYMEEYDSSHKYYKKFVDAKRRNNFEMYKSEDFKIGYVYELTGHADEAGPFFESFAEYVNNDESIYKDASQAAIYAHDGKYDLAIEYLNKFALKDNFQYWVVLFLDMDPVFKKLEGHPDYPATIKKIKDRFWENHNRLRKSLEEEGLI